MRGATGAMKIHATKFPNVNTDLRSGVLGVTECEFVSFTSLKDLDLVQKRFAKKIEKSSKE
jgi:hypothetical protein